MDSPKILMVALANFIRIWITLRDTEVLKESISSTGSVVMSKKEFALAEDPDLIADNYEYHVPIFVFTDKAPEKHPKMIS